MTRTDELPEAFVGHTRSIMGDELFAAFLRGLSEDPPVSIRVNADKWQGEPCGGERVPWSQCGWYLPTRPNFTFDPLLHAGCYYVQEASSMFVERVVRRFLPDRPVSVLDMCAAPGGKSLAVMSALPEGSVLVSNEPVRLRASVLAENISKWGSTRMAVTCNYPRQVSQSKMKFDVIICDVPCSGEGMFRKDAQAIREWSPQNVERCSALQREIVAEAWKCLKPGGLLVYSTCTFNTRENEENVRWILDEYDASLMAVDVEPQWGITGSLLPGFDGPVYRFIPGVTRGEGIFMAAIVKEGQLAPAKLPSLDRLPAPLVMMELRRLLPSSDSNDHATRVELSYRDAIAYLRREALVLPPDVERGILTVTYRGMALGEVKNLGNRANNLYPKEWRIKSTHLPESEPGVLSLTSLTSPINNYIHNLQ